jgi:diacylglycerol kinase (ATP)
LKSAVLIHNPGSGQPRDRYHSVTRIVEALRQRGVTATPQIVAAPTDAMRLTAAAIQANADVIVVHGGDGLVNETMQGLVGTATPLAVWPGGTSNVLARELALPGGIDVLAKIIAAGRTRRVSLGRAGERYFLLMAGIGLDGDVVRAIHPTVTRVTGESAFWLAGLRQLTDWNPVQFHIEAEGGQYSATFAVVANASSHGGGMRFAPEASMDDDLLDVCLFDSTQRHRFARYLSAAATGSHLGLPGVTYLKTRRVVVRGPSSRFVHVDGELLGPLPVSFESVPAALSLVVP